MTAVIVTYNSSRVIEVCLAALTSTVPVIIVDNASADDTLARVRRVRPDAHIIANVANMGLGFAVNQGFMAVKTDFALYMGPDGILLSDALDLLVATAKADEKAALITPLLRNPANGKAELYMMGPGEMRHVQAENVPDGPFCTWFVIGAVFLYRMSAWREVGGFDENIFLFSEDLDLAIRTRQAGYALQVVPAAMALHLSGKSASPSRRVQAIKDWHMTWSHFYIMAKHGDLDAAKAEARSYVRKFGLKALLYVLLLRPKKVRGNLAKAQAAYAFLTGKPSSAGPQGTNH